MGRFARAIIPLIALVVLSGCATFATYEGCKELKTYYTKDKSCPSGYMVLSASDAGYCAPEADIKRAKELCGIWF